MTESSNGSAEQGVLEGIAFLDDATRPNGPRLEGLTEAQRLPGQHLKMFHDHFRHNMEILRDLIRRAAAGEVSAEDMRNEAEAMPILQNYRRFGALCGQHCQIIHAHHSIEDQAIFPELSAKSEAFGRVVARLMAEHEVVHALLVRLIETLEPLIRTPSVEAFEHAREVYDAFEEVLLSHFRYEETEIGDALGYFGIGV